MSNLFYDPAQNDRLKELAKHNPLIKEILKHMITYVKPKSK